MHSGIFEIEGSLDAIEFYQWHPEYKPFVGDHFDKYRILQVGESHYIPQCKDGEDAFSIRYFYENWWAGTCEKLHGHKDECSEYQQWGGWYNTRSVVEDYLAGYRRRAHGIFTEMVKVFAEAYQDRTISSINTEESQNYHHFAFMNFYQMPSLYKGMTYWKSLVRSAKKLDMKRGQATEYAEEVWDTTVMNSTIVLNQVIDALRPNAVIFTSKSAFDAYNSANKTHREMPIICTVHPGCKYWHKPKDTHVGKERLIQTLKNLGA